MFAGIWIYHTRANKGFNSIQKIFLQPSTFVSFRWILSTFTIKNCTKFSKLHLFLRIFIVRLLFKSVLYWCGYGNQKQDLGTVRPLLANLSNYFSLSYPYRYGTSGGSSSSGAVLDREDRNVPGGGINIIQFGKRIFF